MFLAKSMIYFGNNFIIRAMQTYTGYKKLTNNFVLK